MLVNTGIVWFLYQKHGGELTRKPRMDHERIRGVKEAPEPSQNPKKGLQKA